VTFPVGKHKWIGFIKDSEECCSFVVFEDKCLVLDIGRYCQNQTNRQRETTEESKYPPVFQTDLVVNDQADKPSNMRLSNHRRHGDLRR
jgi:hypothetical protein